MWQFKCSFNKLLKAIWTLLCSPYQVVFRFVHWPSLRLEVTWGMMSFTWGKASVSSSTLLLDDPLNFRQNGSTCSIFSKPPNSSHIYVVAFQMRMHLYCRHVYLPMLLASWQKQKRTDTLPSVALTLSALPMETVLGIDIIALARLEVFRLRRKNISSFPSGNY